jgi:HK97 family phage portal protein
MGILNKLKDLFGVSKKGYYPYLESQLWGVAAAAYSPARYNAFAIEGYMQNPVVYRCINLIATSVAGIPWKLYRKMADGKAVQVEEHPMLKLLYKPNPFLGQADFFTNVVSFLQMCGNTYVKAVGPLGAPPRELYTLRPDRFIITDCNSACYDDFPLGYEYTCGATTEFLDPKIVWHGKLWNPLCDFYGLSPLQAAWKSIAQLNASLNWNVALLQNMANPSGILTSETNLSDEQVFRLREQMGQRYQGATNAGRPMVLDGGLTWDQTSLTPHEMEWTAGQKVATKDICVALGVDPVLLGDADNRTYATFKDAEKSFYTATVLPNLDRLRDDFLNGWLLPKFPNTEHMFFEYDRDAIEVLGEDRTVVWDRSLRALKDGLITINEARENIGYSEIEGQADGLDTENEEEYGEKAFGSSKDLHVKRIERDRNKWLKKVHPQVVRRFKQEEKSIVEAIAKASPDKVKSSALEAIDHEAWKNLYRKIYKNVMRDFGEQSLKNVRKSDNDLGWLSDTEDFIDDTIEMRAEEVLDTTKDRVRDAVVGALLLGGGTEKVIEAIESLYDHDTPIRSRAIAETEVITAGNAGSRFAMASLGIPMEKEWITQEDERVRPSHQEVHGQRRKLHENYSNGLRFPGDPLADASEVINCRCIEVYSIF